MISKRFPANTTLEIPTFLNDKKVNGELYAFLLGISKGIDGETIVVKKDMPIQKEICNKLGMKSPKTYRAHLNYLIDKGYVIDKKDRYIIPRVENIYFMIPLETLQYLNDNCHEHIIKIYVYLGQRYQYASSQGFQYEFSSEELGAHTGINVSNNSRGYEIINNALLLLQNSRLIKYVQYYDGTIKKKKLISYTFNVLGKNSQLGNG